MKRCAMYNERSTNYLCARKSYNDRKISKTTTVTKWLLAMSTLKPGATTPLPSAPHTYKRK